MPTYRALSDRTIAPTDGFDEYRPNRYRQKLDPFEREMEQCPDLPDDPLGAAKGLWHGVWLSLALLGMGIGGYWVGRYLWG